MMVVITAVLGYLISTSFVADWAVMGLLFFGGFAITGAANIINQVLERDYDKLMKRTANRPLAANRMNSSTAVFMAGLLCVIGLGALALIHPICGLLGSLSFVSYAFIYTPLKRFSTLAIPVGAIPGALPVLIGCVAGSGTITSLALTLFMIQFLWQFPHFWAIGYLSFEDYKNAGFKLVPQINGNIDPKIALYSVIYCAAILILSCWIAYIGMIVSPLINGLFILVSFLFLLVSLNFYRRQSRKTALQLMFASIIFMPMSLIVFLMDLI